MLYSKHDCQKVSMAKRAYSALQDMTFLLRAHAAEILLNHARPHEVTEESDLQDLTVMSRQIPQGDGTVDNFYQFTALPRVSVGDVQS